MQTPSTRSLEVKQGSLERTSIPSPNPSPSFQSQMIEKTKNKLTSLGFANFSVLKNSKITFSVTNQGQSTEDMWRTFPIVIEIFQDIIKISIAFTVNGKLFRWPANFEEQAIELIISINALIPIGSFKINSSKKSITFETIAKFNTLRPDLWETVISDYLRISINIYKSFGYGFIQLINGKKIDIQATLEICAKRTEGQVAISAKSDSEQSEESDSDGSYENDCSKDELKSLLEKNEIVKKIILVNSLSNVHEKCPCISEIFPNAGPEFITALINTLRLLFIQGLEISKINIQKIHVRYTDGKIKQIVLKNIKNLYFNKNRTEEASEGYTLRLYREINKGLLITSHQSFRNLMQRFHYEIIPESNFVISNIRSNENIIGQGGFGIIYKNILANIPVAIKFPKSKSISAKEFKKFVDEYRTIKELNHNNIIKAYGFAKVDENYGIVMEQCLGGSLNNLSRTHGTLDLKKKLEIMVKVIKAIEYMHIKGFCHFDIKPQNILLDANLEPKITDLGLSRNIYQEENPKPGYTLMYSSPEQLKSRKPDKKSDVWSFGMTLYQVLTQNSPFDYLTDGGRKKLEKNEFYSEIYNSERKPKIPHEYHITYPGIVKIFHDCWKIDPEKRASSTQIRKALIQELKKLLE